MSGTIEFALQDLSSFPDGFDSNHIEHWIRNVVAEEDQVIKRISYFFCSDDYMLEVNRDQLGHDYYTDILTFPFSYHGPIESDILISLDRVRENAQKLNIGLKNELNRVIIHGVLHLCGYDDQSSEEMALMRALEDEYLKMF